MNRSTTPLLEITRPGVEVPTPNKAKIQGAVEFCEAMEISYYKEDVFRVFNISRQQGYKYLRSESSRRHHNNPDISEQRGRKSIITPQQIREMERILETEGIEARALTWEQLGYVALFKERWVRLIIISMFLVERAGSIRKQQRIEFSWATVMLENYPEPEDWHHVRFSDEVHFGWVPQGKLRIIRKPGERYCQNCIQEENEPDEKDKKRHHSGLRWDTVLNQIYFFTMFRVTPTER